MSHLPERPPQGGGLVMLKRAARFPPIAILILVIVAGALFVPGVADLPATDRDEALFVQATRQMHETGNYLDIRFQDEARYKKPIGIYWLQAAATAPFGGADAPLWAYRLPSQVAAFGSVLLVYAIGWTLFGSASGFVGALLFAATILIGVEARLAKTDSVLLFLTLAAQWVLASAWVRTAPVPRAAGTGRTGASPPGARLPTAMALGFWVALGLGILVKGPVVVLVVGLTLLGLTVARRSAALLGSLRPLAGLPLMLLVVLPWFAAIAYQTDGAFFSEAIGHDFLGKIAGGQESHGAPPGSYLLALLGTAWPATPFVLLAWPLMTRDWRRPGTLFCLAWLVPAWLVFEAIPTKLPHYVLPLYPALALMAGRALVTGRTIGIRGWARGLGFLLPLVPLVLGLAALGLLLFVERRLPAWTDLFLIAAIAAGLLGARAFWNGRVQAAVVSGILASAALQAGIYMFALPAFETVWLSPRIVGEAERAAGCPDVAIAAAGYTEPSLVLSAGTDLRRGSGEAAADWLAGEGCRVAAVEGRA
ncbi:ArnT family glycosyltransferase, partial [Propylenella binzhouense]